MHQSAGIVPSIVGPYHLMMNLFRAKKSENLKATLLDTGGDTNVQPVICSSGRLGILDIFGWLNQHSFIFSRLKKLSRLNFVNNGFTCFGCVIFSASPHLPLQENCYIGQYPTSCFPWPGLHRNCILLLGQRKKATCDENLAFHENSWSSRCLFCTKVWFATTIAMSMWCPPWQLAAWPFPGPVRPGGLGSSPRCQGLQLNLPTMLTLPASWTPMPPQGSEGFEMTGIILESYWNLECRLGALEIVIYCHLKGVVLRFGHWMLSLHEFPRWSASLWRQLHWVCWSPSRRRLDIRGCWSW